MFPSECSTPSPLDDSLRDITDVAPCRKRRFRHLGAPDAAVKKPNQQSFQRKRYVAALHHSQNARGVTHSCRVSQICFHNA